MTKVICTLCPRECRLSEGQVGWCRGRTCREGEVVSLNYGRLTSVALDPIEKKPLARFHPGGYILSVGSFGCNLRCPFCQNHEISQAGAEFATQDVMPADLVALAKELAARPAGNLGVAFTYNEPLIGYEFVRDTAKLLHEAGLKVVLVTNGMINAGPFQALLPLVDAFNIDLKGWRQQVYDVCGGRMAGVNFPRTPPSRQPAKKLNREEADKFLSALPHRYYEENQLHAVLLAAKKDYAECLNGVEVFFPYVDNWATCDQLSPKVFRKQRHKLLERIYVWLQSAETYTVRFAVKMLMEHFLDEDFDRSYLSTVAELHSEEYYINMMIAWYFATALAKQYQAALPFLEEKQLAVWTHNKAIQKAIESRRITLEQKTYLRTLKIPAGRKCQQ